MLVLSRRVGEVIRIGEGVTLTVLRVQGGRVQVGVAAPPGIRILRHEVVDRALIGNGSNMLPADSAGSGE